MKAPFLYLGARKGAFMYLGGKAPDPRPCDHQIREGVCGNRDIQRPYFHTPLTRRHGTGRK